VGSRRTRADKKDGACRVFSVKTREGKNKITGGHHNLVKKYTLVGREKEKVFAKERGLDSKKGG